MTGKELIHTGDRHNTPAVIAPTRGMYLGHLAPTQVDLLRLTEFANRLLEHRLQSLPPEMARRAVQISRSMEVLPLFDYIRAVKGFDKYAKQIRSYDYSDNSKGVPLEAPSAALRNFISRGLSAKRTPDEKGWRAYVDEIAPGYADATKRLYRPSAFPDAGRARHTLIVAPTGWGKSELLKAIVHHDVYRTDDDTGEPAAGVVFLDPHGVASRQIARWPDLIRSGRLVYVEPDLEPGWTVGVNLFCLGRGMDYRGQNAVAGIIAQAIGDLSDQLTPNMVTLIRFCVLVLLRIPDATLRDLGLMVRRPNDNRTVRTFDFPDENIEADVGRREVIRQAVISHEDEEVRSFFRYDFDSPENLGTRGWLTTRIKNITAKLSLRQALFGRDTLDLKGCIEAGKIVVVNLEGYGDAPERADMGRMLVGMVAAIGGRRDPKANPRPVHLIVDEATEMVSPRMVEILERLRKFGVHLTLAQQVDGRAFTSEQRAVLATNTRTKIIASTSKKDGAASLGHDDPDELPTLRACLSI